MFIIFLRVIYLKTLIRIVYIVIIPYLSKNYLLFICLFYLFIYLFYYFIYLFKYIVYRKEHSL